MRFQRPSQVRRQNKQFFNQSFYQQRIQMPSSSKQVNQNSYISYQFTKKYFEATRINELINKTVKIALQSPYIPENPYNMIGRLLLHDSIFENVRAYYSMLYTERGKKSSERLTGLENEMADHKKIMKEMKIGNKTFVVGWKLYSILRVEVIPLLWSLVFPEKLNKNLKKIQSSSINEITCCLGGSMILRTGSPYAARELLTPTVLITMFPADNQEHLWQFAQYVINDCIKICESPNNVFLKLYIFAYGLTSTEFSAENLIHNRNKIGKELYKSLVSGLDSIKVDYLAKNSEQNHKFIKTPYLYITKTYVLIQKSQQMCKIHSQQPAFHLLCSIFPQQESTYLKSLCQSLNCKGTAEQLAHQMHAQIHEGIINSLVHQQPTWIGWYLHYLMLYDFSENRTKDKDLRSAVMFMMDSPLGFIDEMRHQLRVTKLLSGRSSAVTHEDEIIALLTKAQGRVKDYIKKQQHVYPETTIFFQALQANLQLILQSHESKRKNIKPILERVQMLIKYLLYSFYQICFVLKGYLLNEIVKIDNQFGKDGSGQIISNTVTYDVFLRKYKDLPDRTLNILEYVKNLRPEIQRSDDDIRELILAKYVKQYSLYELIYDFYWNTICGKKYSYPLSHFIKTLRNKAIQYQCRIYNKMNKRINVDQTKSEGMIIYQKSADTRNDHVFFSLNIEVLEDSNVSQFRTIKDIFDEYFQNDLVSQKSLKSLPNLQQNSYIVSICSSIGRSQAEDSDFNKAKIYVDIIYHNPVPAVELYRTIYEQLVEKLAQLDKNGFGVIGIYSGEKRFMDEDEVMPWIEQEQKFDINFVRYQPKKIINVESIVKLVKTCKESNLQILIRGIFWLNGLLKSCQISVNFHINKQWLLNLQETYSWRAFSKKDDILKWAHLNSIQKYMKSQKQIQSSPEFNHKQSVRLNYLKNQIEMIEFVVQDLDDPIDIRKIRTYSPFYCQLQQSLALVQGFFFLLEYVKIDRTGRFQVKDFQSTVDILEYYLFDRCLRMDRYIYSQGLSVTIINLVSHIHRYIETHQDNNGEEKELIFIQKVAIKLINSIHYVMTSCAFGVVEAIQSEYLVKSKTLL